FLTSPLVVSLSYWIRSLNISSSPLFAPYDSIIQQLLDENGVFAYADLAVVLIRLDSRCYQGGSISDDNACRNLNTLLQSLKLAATRQLGTTFLTISCPPSPSLRCDQSVLVAETRLREACANLRNGYFIAASDLGRYYPPPDYNAYFVYG